jgi:hypothetical protein
MQRHYFVVFGAKGFIKQVDAYVVMLQVEVEAYYLDKAIAPSHLVANKTLFVLLS